MSSSSSSTNNLTRTGRMSTPQHLFNQASQVGACFVLNDYSGDPDTSAFVVGQHVPVPTEPNEQTPWTPTASAKKAGTFDVHAMDDHEELCVSKPPTGQSGTVNRTPTQTACTDAHSVSQHILNRLATFHHANTPGSRAGRLRICASLRPKTIVIHVSCVIPCGT